MRAYAATGLDLGPLRVSIYYINPNDARKLEEQLNRFAKLVGFAPVDVDGEIDPSDAFKAVKIQRWLYRSYVCDAAERKTKLDGFEARLDAANDLAQRQPGDPPTAEQMWLSENIRSVLFRYTELGNKIEAGELKACPMNWKPLIGVAALVVGAAVVMEVV